MSDQTPQQPEQSGSPTPDSPKPESKEEGSKRTLILLIVILVLILAAILGGVVFIFYLRTREERITDDTTTPTTTTTTTTTTGDDDDDNTIQEIQPIGEATTCAEASTPSDWQLYHSTQQEFTISYPAGWDMRSFNTIDGSIGFDPDPIPEVSEYPGLFTLVTDVRDIEELLDETTNSLENVTVGDQLLSCAEAIRIEGTIPDDNAFYAGHKQTKVLLRYGGSTYILSYMNNPIAYDTYSENFTKFLASFRLDSEPAAFTNPSGRVSVNEPAEKSTVSETITVSGVGSSLNDMLAVRLIDSEGEIVKREKAVIHVYEEGGVGPFEVTLTFSQPSSEDGFLEIIYENQSDKDTIVLRMPISF